MRRSSAAVFVAVLLSGFLHSMELSGCTCPQAGLNGHADNGEFFVSPGLNNFTAALTGEIPQFQPAERLYSSAGGPGSDRSAPAKYIEKINRRSQSDYRFLSEFQIIRFEGPRIIQPYFFSW
jgi:hypothetical protein